MRVIPFIIIMILFLKNGKIIFLSLKLKTNSGGEKMRKFAFFPEVEAWKQRKEINFKNSWTPLLPWEILNNFWVLEQKQLKIFHIFNNFRISSLPSLSPMVLWIRHRRQMNYTVIRDLCDSIYEIENSKNSIIYFAK